MNSEQVTALQIYEFIEHGQMNRAEALLKPKTCKDCRWWAETLANGSPCREGDQHLCLHPKVDMPYGDAMDGLDSNADYDYGVTTGPDFGCIHHEIMLQSI